MTFAIYTDTVLFAGLTRAGLGPGGVGSRVQLWLDDVGVEGMAKISFCFIWDGARKLCSINEETKFCTIVLILCTHVASILHSHSVIIITKVQSFTQ